jgi:hypothetical protein
MGEAGLDMPELNNRVAWLIVLGALLVSGAAGAFYGASKVGSHVPVEMSCKLLAHAQREGMLNPRQRREVTQAAVTAPSLSPAAKDAAARVHAGCRGVRVRL